MAALRYALDLAYREYEQAVIGRRTLVEEIRAILDRSLDIMKRRPAITDLLLRGNVDWSHPELQGMTRRPPRRVARFHGAVVERAIERGEIGASDGPMLARLIVTLLWGCRLNEPTRLSSPGAAPPYPLLRQLRNRCAISGVELSD
jgi:hypothetical protein